MSTGRRAQPALGLADRHHRRHAAARRARRPAAVRAQRAGRRRLARHHRQRAHLGHRPDLRARDLALQGANAGGAGPAAREALAAEVDQIRRRACSTDANTTYLGRPVFGGVTAGAEAYDATGTFVGTPARSTGPSRTASRCAWTWTAAGRVRRGGEHGVRPARRALDRAARRRPGRRSGRHRQPRTGTSTGSRRARRRRRRAKRVDAAAQAAADTELRLTSSLSDVENADLPEGDRGPADAADRLPGRPRCHRQGHAAEPPGLPAMITETPRAHHALEHHDRHPGDRPGAPDARLPAPTQFALVAARRRRGALPAAVASTTRPAVPRRAPGRVLPGVHARGRRRGRARPRIESADDVIVLVVLKAGTSLADSTANLLAPVLINTATRRAQPGRSSTTRHTRSAAPLVAA